MFFKDYPLFKLKLVSHHISEDIVIATGHNDNNIVAGMS